MKKHLEIPKEAKEFVKPKILRKIKMESEEIPHSKSRVMDGHMLTFLGDMQGSVKISQELMNKSRLTTARTRLGSLVIGLVLDILKSKSFLW